MSGNAMMTEGNHFGEFVLDMVSLNMSVEQIIVTGGKFYSGSVLSATASDESGSSPATWGAPDAEADAHCVLMGNVNAATADQPGSGLMRLAAVKVDHLEWPEGFAEADKAAIFEKMKAVNLLAQ